MDTESLVQARKYAFLLLKFRPRSCSEISLRLKKKGFEEAMVKATVDFLVEKKFLDDALFASQWMASRLRSTIGIRRIKAELRQKGISKACIDGALRSLPVGYDAAETIETVIEKKWAARGSCEPRKVIQRIYAYLIRRGFPIEQVREALEKYRTFD